MPLPIPVRLRQALRLVHIWAGLTLCLPLAALGVSGSILVFDEEISALFGHKPPQATAIGDRQSLDAIVAAAREKTTSNAPAVSLSLPQTAGAPAIVRFQGARGGQPMRIDPVSLERIEGPADPMPPWMRQIFLLHANFLAGSDGRNFVGWLGVVMVGFGLSGLVIWWPRPQRWRAAFAVSRKAKGLRFHRELHGAVGIWGLLVFLVVSFSGVYIVFPQTTGSAVTALLPARDLRQTMNQVTVSPLANAQRIGLDQAMTTAQSAMPNATGRSVTLPQRPDQPYRIAMTSGAADAPMITVFVDPWRGEIVKIMDPKAYSAGEKILLWQRPLHVGDGLGFIYKFLVFLSGLMPVVFAVTGIAMWWHKRRRKLSAVNVPAE